MRSIDKEITENNYMVNEKPLDTNEENGVQPAAADQSKPTTNALDVLVAPSEILLELLFETQERPVELLTELKRCQGFLEEKGDNQPLIDFLKDRGIFVTEETLLPAVNKAIEIGKRVISKRKTDDPDAMAKKLLTRIEKLLGTSERPRRGRVLQVFADVIKSLRHERHTMDPSDIVRLNEEMFTERMLPVVYESLKNGKLDYRTVYTRPDLWENVEKSPDYVSLKKGIEILKQHLPEIVDIVARGKPNVKIFDLGVGTGKKPRLIKDVFIKEGKNVDLHLVDTSPFMLKATTVIMMEDLMRQILAKAATLDGIEGQQTFFMHDETDIGTDMPEKRLDNIKSDLWFPLIEMCRKYKLEFSKNEHLRESLHRIFYKFLLDVSSKEQNEQTDDTSTDLIKNLAARILSLHIGRQGQRKIIDELDEKIQLPLKIHLRLQAIEDLPAEDFQPSDNEGVFACDLGCRAFNDSPQKTIPMYLKFLSNPKVPEGVEDPVPEKDEPKVEASYLLIGFQLSHFTKKSPEFEKESKIILKGYDTEASFELITAPFKLSQIKYYNNNGGLVTFKDLLMNDEEENNYAEVITEYEEDPANPEYLRIVHKLKFKKDLIFKVGDYPPFKKLAGEEILLPPSPSYKPILGQITGLCEENGIKVCKNYVDNDKCPKYVKLLVRRMTDKEKIAYIRRTNGIVDRREYSGNDYDPGGIC